MSDKDFRIVIGHDIFFGTNFIVFHDDSKEEGEKFCRVSLTELKRNEADKPYQGFSITREQMQALVDKLKEMLSTEDHFHYNISTGDWFYGLDDE